MQPTINGAQPGPGSHASLGLSARSKRLFLIALRLLAFYATGLTALGANHAQALSSISGTLTTGEDRSSAWKLHSVSAVAQDAAQKAQSAPTPGAGMAPLL